MFSSHSATSAASSPEEARTGRHGSRPHRLHWTTSSQSAAEGKSMATMPVKRPQGVVRKCTASLGFTVLAKVAGTLDGKCVALVKDTSKRSGELTADRRCFLTARHFARPVLFQYSSWIRIWS